MANQSVKTVSEKDISICILFFEKLDQTIECIRSFLLSSIKIYILNNGSSGESRQLLGDFCRGYEQVKIIDSDINLGVSIGRNRLIGGTSEEWLFFVDNDIVVNTPGWPQKMMDHIRKNDDIEVFIPRLYNSHEQAYSAYRKLRINKNKAINEGIGPEGISNKFPGGASFISRKLFNRLGLYDEKIFTGSEDVEYAIRGILAGAPIKAKVIGDIELIHNHRAVEKEEDKKAVLVRYDVDRIQRSYDRIFEKHGIILEDNWKSWVSAQVKSSIKNDENSGAVKGISHMLGKVSIFHRKDKRTLPTGCSLFMSAACNFKCKGCSRNILGVKYSRDLELPTVQKLLSIYPGIGSFCVAGLGEPTLCRDFIAIVDHLKSNGKYVGIITNGTSAEKIIKLGHAPDYVSISLYGYNGDSYRRTTGVDAFAKVIENYSKIRLKFDNVGFSYVVNRMNYRELKDIIELCDKAGPDFLNIVNYLPYDAGSTAETSKILARVDIDIIKFIDEATKSYKYVKVKPTYVDLKDPRFKCRSYFDKINLDGNGNIGGCMRQIPSFAVFGNIFTDNDPYNSAEMKRLRERIRNKCYAHDECRFCFGNWQYG